ncbi:hypothetical protein MBLNU13_g07630t1 [Cladosporium sp. NU13]
MATFFSFPPEIRDMVYDNLHQYEQQLDTGRMTYALPLTHVRNISREFREEYDKRTPAKTSLVISQGNWCWGKFMAPRFRNSLGPVAFSGPLSDPAEKKRLPKHLPKLVTAGRITSFTDLELNFDVYDEIRMPDKFLADFGAYSNWVSDLLYREHHLPRAICGGEVHLRLFFSYLNTFNSLRRLIAKTEHWFNVQCSKISLVLYGGGDGIPNEASLSRAQILAVWTKGFGWQVEEETIQSLRAEIV